MNFARASFITLVVALAQHSWAQIPALSASTSQNPKPHCSVGATSDIVCGFLNHEARGKLLSNSTEEFATNQSPPEALLTELNSVDRAGAYTVSVATAGPHGCVRFTGMDAGWTVASAAPIMRGGDSSAALALLVDPDDDIRPQQVPAGLIICHRQEGKSNVLRFSILIGPATAVEQALLNPPSLLQSGSIRVLSKSDSRVKNGSYLMIPTTSRNAEQIISWAKKGGFQYLLVPVGSWATTYGSYPVNLANFPTGLSGLAALARKARESGVNLGLHTLTGLVSKTDPLVTQHPEQLLSTPIGNLAGPIAADSSNAQLHAGPSRGSVEAMTIGSNDVVVGREIMTCKVIGPSSVSGCTRAVSGSRAEPHPDGAPMAALLQRNGAYIANLRSPIRDSIAARIAQVITEAGAAMVYFDGGELSAANGDPSFFIAEQQIAALKRISTTQLLVEGSGLVTRMWPYLDRVPTDDYAALAPVAYLDQHKIAEVYAYLRGNLMPGQLGWIGLLPQSPAYPATNVEETSTYLARSLALHIPFSIETTLDNVIANPYSERLFSAFASTNRALAERTPSVEDRKKFASGWWYFLQQPSPRLANVVSRKQIHVESGIRSHLEWALPNAARSVYLRISNISKWERGASANKFLVGPDGAAVVVPGSEIGTVAASVDPAGTDNTRRRGRADTPASAALDLRAFTKMTVQYDADSSGAANKTDPTVCSVSVLDVQLEDAAGLFRDYLLDIHAGRNQSETLRFEDAPERLLALFKIGKGPFDVKRSVYTFDFGQVVRVNFRWIRSCPRTPTVRLHAIEMLREQPTQLHNVNILIGAKPVLDVALLRSGETLDMFPDGSGLLCDHGQCRNIPIKSRPPGELAGSRISVTTDGEAGYDVSFGALGDAIALTHSR